MQRVLQIKWGRGKIISKPWDFEAMCLVDDNRGGGEIKMCIEAVYYLFEGTSMTNDRLRKISAETLSALCRTVWIWYVSDAAEMIKYTESMPKEQGGVVTMRDIYAQMFKAWGKLPHEVALCRPHDLFAVIGSKTNENAIPPEAGALYGL